MCLDLEEAVHFNRSRLGSEARSVEIERRIAQLVAAWQAANDFPVVDGKWTEEVSRSLDQTFLLQDS